MKSRLQLPSITICSAVLYGPIPPDLLLLCISIMFAWNIFFFLVLGLVIKNNIRRVSRMCHHQCTKAGLTIIKTCPPAIVQDFIHKINKREYCSLKKKGGKKRVVLCICTSLGITEAGLLWMIINKCTQPYPKFATWIIYELWLSVES